MDFNKNVKKLCIGKEIRIVLLFGNLELHIPFVLLYACVDMLEFRDDGPGFVGVQLPASSVLFGRCRTLLQSSQ